MPGGGRYSVGSASGCMLAKWQGILAPPIKTPSLHFCSLRSVRNPIMTFLLRFILLFMALLQAKNSNPNQLPPAIRSAGVLFLSRTVFAHWAQAHLNRRQPRRHSRFAQSLVIRHVMNQHNARGFGMMFQV